MPFGDTQTDPVNSRIYGRVHHARREFLPRPRPPTAIDLLHKVNLRLECRSFASDRFPIELRGVHVPFFRLYQKYGYFEWVVHDTSILKL